jgi:hypothetical protein
MPFCERCNGVFGAGTQLSYCPCMQYSVHEEEPDARVYKIWARTSVEAVEKLASRIGATGEPVAGMLVVVDAGSLRYHYRVTEHNEPTYEIELLKGP